MTRKRLLSALVPLLVLVATAPAHGQVNDIPGPVGGAPAALPALTLPDMTDLRLAVPRPVRAATAALGLGRQRLALVVGMGMVGAKVVLDSAPRDTQAVAAALRGNGFVVMLREDVSGTDLRRSLGEFQNRLQPGGLGFIYVTGLGVQLDGRNLLLPREAPLDAGLPPDALAPQLRAVAVPVAELVDALAGTPDSLRLLVVDAAYRHPALATLPDAGLAAQRLPPGMMALFGQALGVVQDVPAGAVLPTPPPAGARELAASRFASVLVATLAKPRISGPEALRTTRRVIVDGSTGQIDPWLAGDTDAREELAEATLLDGAVPQTPEEAARDAGRQGVRMLTRQSAGRAAGEQTVDEVLKQASAQPAAPATATAPATALAVTAPDTAAAPDAPSASSLGSALGATAGAVGVVANMGGTAVGVAATVVAAAATVRMAEASAVSVASTAVGAAGSAASGTAALAGLAVRAVSGGSGDKPVPAATQAPAAQAVRAPVTMPVAVPTSSQVAQPATAALMAKPAPPAMVATATTAGPGTAAAATNARLPTAARVAAASPLLNDPRTTRTADGGERPVFNPRINRYGYAEGDTFTYRVIDVWKGEVTGRTVTAIESVLDDGQMLANGSQVQMDAQGRLKKLASGNGAVSEFQPSQDLWWSNPQRGESRPVQFTETFSRADRSRGQTEWKGSTSVGRPRRIELPAGTFDVLPIESSGWYEQTLANGARTSGQWSRTVWYSPQLGHPVAIDIEDADGVGKLLTRERVELLHAQTSRALP